jgi:hypothetical protein
LRAAILVFRAMISIGMISIGAVSTGVPPGIPMAAFAKSPVLPVPPIPPAVPPPADAPIPDPDLQAPYGQSRTLPVTLDLLINHREPPAPGLAFAPGSHYQLDNDRKWLYFPGIMFHVPFP